MQRGKITRNVCTLVDPPSPKRSESSPLTVDDARRVLHAAQGVRNSARWTVALALGLRQSEALGLKWSDVDLDRGTLSIRRGLHRVAGQGLCFSPLEVHPRVVMELLGHSQMRTITDVYSHVMPALAREAADRMGTTLWGPDRN